MNAVSNNKMIAGLRLLCERDEVADRLFTIFSERKNDAREMTVRRAADLAGSDYYSMLKVIRALHELDAGRFIPGRHGYESRISWNYSIKSLGKIAIGKSSIPEQVDDAAGVEDTVVTDPATLIKHEFALRSDLRVKFDLPADLNEKEAARLGAFIGTLPL